MNPQIAAIFVGFLYVLVACIIVRSLLSYFPIQRDNQFVQILDRVVEPLVQPVRRFLPRTGIIDFSGLIVIVILYIMIAVVQDLAAG